MVGTMIIGKVTLQLTNIQQASIIIRNSIRN